jgi:histidine triad (HIT) family protein
VCETGDAVAAYRRTLHDWAGIYVPAGARVTTSCPFCDIINGVAPAEYVRTVMFRAAELAVTPCNLITSAGRAATQSVMHLHLHLVPRLDGDGLALPWSRKEHS